MIIQKSKTVGVYGAEQWINGVMYYEAGATHTEALMNLFKKLKWNDIGNWNKTPKYLTKPELAFEQWLGEYFINLVEVDGQVINEENFETMFDMWHSNLTVDSLNKLVKEWRTHK